MITWGSTVARYAEPIKMGLLLGLVTGIVGPIYQYKYNEDNPETPDVDESGIQWLNKSETVHSWAIGYAISLVVILIGYGFGSLGGEWIALVFAAALAHLAVAYISSFVVPFIGKLGGG